MDFKMICEFINGVTEDMINTEEVIIETKNEVVTEREYKVEKANKDFEDGFPSLSPIILEKIHNNHVKELNKLFGGIR